MDTNEKTEERLVDRLKAQMSIHLKGQFYHYTQVAMAYNSNHIEGNSLTEDDTAFLYETRQIKGTHYLDDATVVNNHFKLFGYMLETSDDKITSELMKTYHKILKSGIEQDEMRGFAIGEYKKIPNAVGGRILIAPEEVADEIDNLLLTYNFKSAKTLEEIVAFHFRFELIHPFQDGNGRVGRMLMFKECLRNNIMPFIILDRNKEDYYKGLKEYERQPDLLVSFCRHMQEEYGKKHMEFFPGRQISI